MSMDMVEFEEFVGIAIEKDKEDRFRQEWIVQLPYMSLQMLQYKSFEDYRDDRLGKNIDTRPAEVIIREIEELHRKGEKHGHF